MTEREIFLAALEYEEPALRAAYVAGACRGDAALRSRVEALLRSHAAAGSFLGTPAVELADSAAMLAANLAPELGAALLGSDASAAADRAEILGFLEPPQRAGSLGRIGHYEVLEVLGQGGFGVVFRAFDEVLERVVAVKVLAPQMAATSPARKRFLREARSSASVHHDNVVQVYAVEEQPLPYLVMEFLPGETLQQRLDRNGPLEVAEVLRIGRQIAEGLAAAHTTGLIHRDIKPGNVLLYGGPPERVKITDFGLARAVDDASLTRSGVVAGTPLYMAPEQARGEALDHRADLFSLGSVLYALCTGRPPFRASGTMAVLKRVCDEQPRPIREVIPEVPEELCQIIAKLHAKEPGDRFQNAGEAAEALAWCEQRLHMHGQAPRAEILSGFSAIPSQKAPPSVPSWAEAKPYTVALIVLLIVALTWFAIPAVRYAGNQCEVVVEPAPGLVSLIVWRDGAAVTDWIDVKNKKERIKLPPGKYEIQPNLWRCSVMRWELTNQGMFGSHTSWQGTRNFTLDLARGERVTVRAVLRAE